MRKAGKESKARNKYQTDPEYREKVLKANREAYRARRESLSSGEVQVVRGVPESRILNSARWRAKKKGVPFDLTIDDIRIPTHCPVLGIELRHGVGSICATSPTLDRIIPHLGYVVGNVAVISMRANAIKSNAVWQEVLKVASWMMHPESADNEYGEDHGEAQS